MFIKQNKNNTKKDLFNVYQENKQMLYAVALDILKDPFLAEDILHDTYVNLLRHLDYFSTIPDDKKRGYLYNSVRNTAINLYNRQKNRISKTIAEEFSDLSAHTSPEELVIAAESINYIMQAIAEMDEKYRMVIVLRLQYDLSDDEIAKKLNITSNAVRVRRHRGREILKQALLEGGVGNV